MTTRPATPPSKFDEEERHLWVTRVHELCPDGPITVTAEMLATDEIIERRRENEK